MPYWNDINKAYEDMMKRASEPLSDEDIRRAVDALQGKPPRIVKKLIDCPKCQVYHYGECLKAKTNENSRAISMWPGGS